MLSAAAPQAHEWDAFVERHPRAHLLQMSAWGKLKAAYGWDVERVALKDEQRGIVAGAQVLLRPLPAPVGTLAGKLAYIPMGPLVTDDSDYKMLWKTIQSRVTRKHNAPFIKIEPGIFPQNIFLPHESAPGLNPPDYTRFGFRESPQTVQPPSTVLIDLRQSEDDILARMNQGTRRKIRTGAKKGVTYYQAQREDMAKFNALMQTTGERNEFGVHESGYYEMAYDLFVPQHAAVFLAEHEGETLAAVFVFAVGANSWYIAGASSNEKRNLMASYGVQWEAIRWAKARGCTTYDMWGIPDESIFTLEREFENRSDGLWGVYGFKRGWGGEVVRSIGAWDKPYNPMIYWAYRTALFLRS